MIRSYTVTCNLIEIQNHLNRVMGIVKAGRCVGFSVNGDQITFHFATKGGAMMTFLDFETFLDNLSVTTSHLKVDTKNLKGVFKYD